jgi:hypothetical protein
MVRPPVFFALLLLVTSLFQPAPAPPKPGFVVHFDFISNVREGRDLVRIAAKAGAQVINVVPPAHIWENKQAMRMLDGILDEISRHKLSFVFTRIDAAFPPVNKREDRLNYLYGEILTSTGRMPSGRETAGYFRTTIGRKGYAEWMEEETRYYGEHYGRSPNLLGINLGPFSEPFSAERCGFLEYENDTQRYEVTQYTPEARDWFHGWLGQHYNDVRGVNREYGTDFSALEQVPLPLNETDSRFGKPDLAYFDFVRSLNDWLVERYERCRCIWHQASGRADVPFILQLNGFFAEKLVKGRPSFAAFDIPGWISMADAVGLSLYTNNGYPDFGHASVRASINVVALARDLQKDVFVLEGGTEAPNVILDPGELEFYGTVARRLNPRTYTYEFLKDKFDEPYASNPGKLVTSNGKIRQPAFKALRNLFQNILADRASLQLPEIYFVSDALAARGDPQAGRLDAALYDIASDVGVRWVPAGAEAIIHSGIPVLMHDGSVSPAHAELSRLFREIPDVDDSERETWHQAVVEAIHGASRNADSR